MFLMSSRNTKKFGLAVGGWGQNQTEKKIRKCGNRLAFAVRKTHTHLGVYIYRARYRYRYTFSFCTFFEPVTDMTLSYS